MTQTPEQAQQELQVKSFEALVALVQKVPVDRRQKVIEALIKYADIHPDVYYHMVMYVEKLFSTDPVIAPRINSLDIQVQQIIAAIHIIMAIFPMRDIKHCGASIVQLLSSFYEAVPAPEKPTKTPVFLN